MRNAKIGYKTGMEKQGSTGDTLALDLFSSEGWSSSSSEIKERHETYTITSYSEQLTENSEESASATLETAYQQIQDRLTYLELMVKSLINNNVSQGHQYTVSDEPEYSDEEWLSKWKSEEPDIFISKYDIRNQISQYEEKYNLTSETLLNLVREDKVPDNNDINDWLILLELL
jgi:hypothetical protein